MNEPTTGQDLQVMEVDGYQFRGVPFPHQLAEWQRNRENLGWALLWEQGTGKSKEMIDQASWMYLKGMIDAVIVVAPNGVHRNWVEEEIPAHLPESLTTQTRALFFQSDKSGTKWHKQAWLDLVRFRGFAWLTISYEAFTTVAGKQALIEMFHKRKVLFVLDEAHYITNPDAARTVSILKAAQYAVARRALTGTPISTGPFNLYSLMNFVINDFWKTQGLQTFTEYRAHFAVIEKGWDPTGWSYRVDPKDGVKKKMPGREYEKIKTYRRLDELRDIVKTAASRVTKESAGLKLPPKKYTKEYFTMTPEQAELYKELKEEYMVWLGSSEAREEKAMLEQSTFCFSCNNTGEIDEGGYIYVCPECGGSRAMSPEMTGDGTLIVARMAMTRMLRLQQITCGYLPTPQDEDEPVYYIPGENRRLELFRRIARDAQAAGKKVIVWARFQLDITSILDALKAEGIRAVRYDGLVDANGRSEAKALFKGERPIFEQGVLVGREKVHPDDQASVFVGNPSAGATGLTLNIAKMTVYYSNSFKLIDRLQSEDRNHRIGQTSEVEYKDLIAEHSIDEGIVKNLRGKFSIAGQILGDEAKDWL